MFSLVIILKGEIDSGICLWSTANFQKSGPGAVNFIFKMLHLNLPSPPPPSRLRTRRKQRCSTERIMLFGALTCLGITEINYVETREGGSGLKIKIRILKITFTVIFN